jgi:hypothetical protein
MIRLRRLALLLVPVVAGMVSASLPGRAQQNTSSGRYAFADTTLLRDTLGLHFDRLFPLADSLRTTPDTLRALAIRYLVPIERIAMMADSMHAPVDSVSARIERERYSPFAANIQSITEFNYGTSYAVLQNQNTWTNNLNTRVVRGTAYFSNVTTLSMTQVMTARSTSQKQNRNSDNELGWRVTPNGSIGVRALFIRFTSNDPSTIVNIDQPHTEYQLSIRTRQQPNSRVNSEINVLSGYLNVEDATQLKKGGSGEVNGHLTADYGDLATHDLSGSLSGDLSRILLKQHLETKNTHDLTQTLHLTSILWPSGRASLSGDVNYRNFFNQAPDDSDRIQDARNASFDMTGTMRLRDANDRQLNFSDDYGSITSTSAVLNAQSNEHHTHLAIDGRTPLLGSILEGRFGHDFTNLASPQLSDSGGYGQRSENRALEGTLSRQFGKKLTTRLTGRISLARYRYYTIGRYITLPVPRDQAQQTYRIDFIYTPSTDFNMNPALEVGRIELDQLPSSAVLSNNVARTYRMQFNWTFRLLRNLTVTQQNNALASYSDYPFNGLNNRLSLDYITNTTLNAVLSPRVSLDLNHITESVQGGNYLLQPDGLNSFLPADDTKNYTLSTRLTWAPVTGVSLALGPVFTTNRRFGTSNGLAVLQRDNGNLLIGGNLSLNLPVGSRGKLTGTLGRQYQDNLTTAYGTNASSVKSQFDYWTSNLQFTWHL